MDLKDITKLYKTGSDYEFLVQVATEAFHDTEVLLSDDVTFRVENVVFVLKVSNHVMTVIHINLFESHYDMLSPDADPVNWLRAVIVPMLDKCK